MMVPCSHSCFPLTVAPPALPGLSGIPSEPSAPPVPEAAETPTNSAKKGSFHYDQERGGYPMEWPGPAEFEAWRQEEELAYSIELITSSTVHGRDGGLWTLRGIYICSCQLSGGWNKYQKKHLEWECKIDSKKTGCWCHIIIKYYPHTSAILRCYASEHDHEISLANIAYTWMSQVAREKIKYKLAQKIDSREIVHNPNFNFGGGPDTVAGA
jgi:hypothetical protein